jgi:phosphatidylinositol glycan class B
MDQIDVADQGRSGAFEHVTQQDMFYSLPVSYLDKVFPHWPVSLHEITRTQPSPTPPSHIILFGCLLDQVEVLQDGTERSVREALLHRGYREVRHLYNGFDWAQDDDKRRGGVRIWRKLLYGLSE